MPEFKKASRPYVFLAVVLLLLSVKVWFLRSSFQAVDQQNGWVIHTMEVANQLEQVISACKDAQTGVRSYLLTRRDEYLAPHNAALTAAHLHLKKVHALTADNPEQHQSALQLEENINDYFKLLGTIRDSSRSLINEPVALNRLLSDGTARMDVIRAQVNEMKTREEALLAKRTAMAENGKTLFYWTLYLSNILLATVLLFAFMQIARNILRTLEESAQKDRDSQRRTIVATFARSVAGDHDLQSVGTSVLREFTKNFGILGGKVYVQDRGQLRVAASYGVDEAQSVDTWNVVPSLVKSALDRAEFWQVREVPENYWTLSSGLGSMKPRVLSFIPLRFQGTIIGVIETATADAFSVEQVELSSSLSETIGVGVNAALAKTQLQVLLEKTQQQSAELHAQQEELRSSNEELEQQARALESQQQALNLKNKELESTQSQLEIRAQDLERSTQYKSEFLAKMSHELRTPLNGLLILSTLLMENKERNLTDQQRQFARSINNAGNDLLMLISDILDLSKIEARKLTLKAESFGVADLFKGIETTFDPQAKAKNLALNVSLPPALETLSLHTDRQRLEQVLRNFISNALKFTEEGEIAVSAQMINNDKIKISVRDSGVGIPLNKQQLIFEAFEQADSSVSRQYGGTGLGLTISRELAGLLGGQITLDSREGQGSTFAVIIPVHLPSKNSDAEVIQVTPVYNPALGKSLAEPIKKDESASEIEQTAKEALEGIETDKTILVVEDDDAFRASVVTAVESYGFEAVEAADGEVALAILRAFVPSAILLDIKLPGISGLGILEMIKQMPHLRHIPVHMISGLEYQHNALRMGALGYLTKPVTIDKVRAAIGRIEKLVSSQVRRVLLIEDDSTQRMAVSELISGSDIEVIPAKTGSEAVKHIKQGSFDCIILDLVLPDVSGFDLLAELTKLDVSLPPIVIYTGKELTQDEERYLRQFSESIIIKGARSPERLLDEVNLFLHRVESLLPEATRDLLVTLRSKEKTFEGKTVLIADDDIRNIFALTSALESKGLKVEVARDGLEALKVLEEKPDVNAVLMDIMMPKMDGFEATREIRKHKNARIRKLPIIALTAKAMREDHEKCIEAGASDYLPKPVNLDNLTTILKVWLTPKGLLE